MATTSPATPAADSQTGPTADGATKDWPVQATEAIVTQVDRIREKTTGPVLKAAQYVLFGFFAVSLGTVALVISVIGAVRALNNYLPDSVFGETHTWAAHSILGAVLLVAGVTIGLTKARRRPADS